MLYEGHRHVVGVAPVVEFVRVGVIVEECAVAQLPRAASDAARHEGDQIPLQSRSQELTTS